MPDEPLNDNLERLKAKLGEVPPDKKGVFVLAVDWKMGMPTTYRTGVATKIGENWQIAGEAEMSKLSKKATVYVMGTW